MRARRTHWMLTLVGFALVARDVAADGPILHEPIPLDPREDVALRVALDGDLPAAIDTPHGLITAPDPGRPIDSRDSRARLDAAPDATFQPDRDTKRPDVLPYEDPFTPSTAPFKRLLAFDAVDVNYTLFVRDKSVAPLPLRGTPSTDGSEETFFADVVVDFVANTKVRIPSVGPGARVLRARAAIQTREVPFRLYRDAADNWFVEAETTTRARLVMELSIARDAFGGEFKDVRWEDLPRVPSLPNTVERAAMDAHARLGLGRQASPRDNVAKMVEYFRGFADSEEPPAASKDIYLDLVLSQKGVCRHRAFAFLVTSLALGIPTRFVANEAHAWVEVFDGTFWRRIDLGGAGRTMELSTINAVKHDAPPDPFSWPAGSTRGDDLADRARRATRSGAEGSESGRSDGPSQGPVRPERRVQIGERPAARVELTVDQADVRRGLPMAVRGRVTSGGDSCAHLVVDIALRPAREVSKEVFLGTLATNDKGEFSGPLVLPRVVPLGDYDVVATTPGDAHCGAGASAP